MPQDIREYFKNGSVNRHSCSLRIGTQLTRGGVSDMDTLCALLEQNPNKLHVLRNIGPKSMEIIREACTAYLGQKGTPLEYNFKNSDQTKGTSTIKGGNTDEQA